MSKKIKILILLFILAAPLLAMPRVNAAAAEEPKKIYFAPQMIGALPGINELWTNPKGIEISPKNFSTIFKAVYLLALNLVGILAALAIMIGGFEYIMSFGNPAAINKGKAWIWGAIQGLALAFSTYTFLYLINPDLVIIRDIKLKQVEIASTPPGMSAWHPSSEQQTPYGQDTCNKFITNSDKKINFNTITKKNLPSGCVSGSQLDNAFNSTASGDQLKLLKTVAAIESKCTSNMGKSPAGACGVMQIMPQTAKGLDPTNKELSNEAMCNKLISDNQYSIKLAAKYLSENENKSVQDQLAIYNGGKDAVNPSTDCPNSKKYECCVKPNGLAETQNYIPEALMYYNNM